MNQRSETDIMAKVPIKVRLGSRDHDVQILPTGKSQKWRTKFNEVMGPVITAFRSPIGPQSLQEGFSQSILAFPEKIVEMLKAYAPYLPWDDLLYDGDDVEKLKDAATEEQLSVAFAQVMQIAYPFLTQLGTITSALRASASLQ